MYKAHLALPPVRGLRLHNVALAVNDLHAFWDLVVSKKRPDRGQDVQPVGVREVEIEHDEVGLALVERTQPIVPIFGTDQLGPGSIREPSQYTACSSEVSPDRQNLAPSVARLSR